LSHVKFCKSKVIWLNFYRCSRCCCERSEQSLIKLSKKQSQAMPRLSRLVQRWQSHFKTRICAHIWRMRVDRDMYVVNIFLFSLTKLFRFQVAASVPDLITILDSQSGSHLGTAEYKPPLSLIPISLIRRYISTPACYRWDMLFLILSHALSIDPCSNCPGLPPTLA